MPGQPIVNVWTFRPPVGLLTHVRPPRSESLGHPGTCSRNGSTSHFGPELAEGLTVKGGASARIARSAQACACHPRMCLPQETCPRRSSRASRDGGLGHATPLIQDVQRRVEPALRAIRTNPSPTLGEYGAPRNMPTRRRRFGSHCSLSTSVSMPPRGSKTCPRRRLGQGRVVGLGHGTQESGTYHRKRRGAAPRNMLTLSRREHATRDRASRHSISRRIAHHPRSGYVRRTGGGWCKQQGLGGCGETR